MMNNNIQENYCSSEVRKLLKMKGFDVKIENVIPMSAVTHSLAINWIRENFGLHIYTDYNDIHKWWYCINDLSDNGRVDKSQFFSSNEATDAAISYALQNLI